ncbi:MAG TPA: hypothetical protein VN279_13370, partial [Rhodocyclaceae bacterium]|nr:hypothetical protein [Rhodocyclaceae bacterium]
MSEPIQQLPGGDRAYDRQDLHRYYQTNAEIESSRHHIEDVDRERRALEQSEAVALFQKQIELLQRRLVSDPKFFRDAFIAEGTNAISWEFQQEELGEKFTRAFWGLLLRGDAMSSVLLRFIWGIPLKYKRKFIRAIDVHLSERYPMFKGLSEGWPGQNAIPPYIRPAEERAKDFELVTQGYLGYMSLGYSFREVEMLVWLEVLRDKQCDDRPCELGVHVEGKAEA